MPENCTSNHYVCSVCREKIDRPRVGFGESAMRGYCWRCEKVRMVSIQWDVHGEDQLPGGVIPIELRNS